jgi:hypothetical protein
MDDTGSSFLRKQAWDYFSTHAAQRIATFNFYIILSSLVTTTYFASFKDGIDVAPVRPALGGLLCLFAFIFWKLDQRNRALIKNAERALRHFEAMEDHKPVAKVFTQEEIETQSRLLTGCRRLLFWRAHLSYSDCFNSVFAAFFLVGLLCLILSGFPRHRSQQERYPDGQTPHVLEPTLKSP